jgi:ribosomal protein L11 methyltransferase
LPGGAVKLIEVGVETDGEAAEAISAVFNRYSQNGTVIEEVWSEPPAPPVIRVKTFLSVEQSCALPQIEQALWHLGRLYPIPAPSVRYLAEEDWAEAWKSDYKALRIGQHIVIKPSWQSYAATSDQVVIELNPGLAFGTGLHPSTQLMLEALERHVQPGDRVLDVGTGSGILAIAAIKLGAGNVVALDIDSLALEVARENVGRNGVQDQVLLQQASLTPASISSGPQNVPPVFDVRSIWNEGFDLLLMNILADVIARSAEPIAACLAEGGQFIVSGIIQPQEEQVRQAFLAAGLSVVKRRSKKDWVALIGRKGSRKKGGA